MSGISKKCCQLIETTRRVKKYFIRWVVSIRWNCFLFIAFGIIPLTGCDPSEIKPVAIYPEDMCSHCRMAISDQRFAAEIITVSGEVFKFDDLGCMERYQEKMNDLKIAARYVKDYEQKIWIAFERSRIIRTSIKTPMSSGQVAFADSSQAQEYLRKFPAME
jgi:copper chaperone NosL